MLPDYIQKSLQKSKPLSLEEEKTLTKLTKSGCEKSKRKLIEANFKLVMKIAKGFKGCGVDLEDLIQEGNLGLIKAAEKFDPEKGFKFSTYATWWIRQSILQALDEKGRTVKIPSWVLRILGKARKFSDETSLDVVASRVGVSKEKLEIALFYGQRDTESEVLDRESLEEIWVEDRIFEEESGKLLKEALKTLTEKERIIVSARFDLEDKGEEETLQKIGDRLALTNERVRQIEKKALEKLKLRLEKAL